MLLMRVKEECEKVGLKLSIQKTKTMASSPITSRQIEGEKVEAVIGFIFLDSKITADGDCSHEIKILAPWKKSYDQPRQHIKKTLLKKKKKEINLPTKVCLDNAMVLPVVIYGCESWTIKKAER